MGDTHSGNLNQKHVPKTLAEYNAALFDASFWYKFMVQVSSACVTPTQPSIPPG